MFETLEATKPDPILALMQQFRVDERSDKVDLGVGVYRDAEGQTPVLKAVKEAERRLYDEETSKSYVSPSGDAVFCDAMRQLVFGQAVASERVKGIQTPGGSGALRVLSDMLISVNPHARTWVSDPTWPNHLPMLLQAGHTLEHYPYYDASNSSVDFDAMMQCLQLSLIHI